MNNNFMLKLRKIIKEERQKLLKENDGWFTVDISEPFNRDEELKAADKSYEISTKIEIDNVDGIISDDEVDLNIDLNNGDSIHANFGFNGRSSVKITPKNGNEVSLGEGEIDSAHGSTGTAIGDVIIMYLYWKKNYK